jgi:hypothetical protein
MRVFRDAKYIGPAAAAVREPESTESGISRPAGALNDPDNQATSRRPSGIARVPTHAVGRGQERRAYARARLSLPLSVQRVAGQRDANNHTLRTKDISSSGVYFLSPNPMEPGTPIELELLVVHRPFGHGSVRMRTEAHVVRSEGGAKPGWHGVAAAFDDISFLRDEPLPAQVNAD